MLAPGAQPLRPPLPGIDDPRLFTLRNLGDMDRIKAATNEAAHVTVIGAGFIGLEMAEQFRHAGKAVTLVELQPHVLPLLDQSMTQLMEDELKRHDVELLLGDGIASFAEVEGRLGCTLASGRVVTTDFAVLALGVRPDTALARGAGLDLGPRGHIIVDTFMRTSDPDIYAGGDAIQVEDFVSGDPGAVPLGGPANRQGRLAADHIFRPDQAKPFPGVLGTAIVRVFEVSAGLTGWTEKRLQAAGRDYRAVTVNDNQAADAQDALRPRHRPDPRRAGHRTRRSRQAPRCAGDRHHGRAHHRRCGPTRAFLRAPLWLGQRHRQSGRLHRRQRPRWARQSG